MAKEFDALKTEDKEWGRVLVTDDEDDVRALLCRAIENLGCGLLEATTGEGALEVLRNEKVNVVVTDLKMPGMGGMELFKQIQKIYPGMPVILITGFGDINMAVQAIKSGADDYLLKPFDLQRFIVAVQKALRKRYPYLGSHANGIEGHESLAERMGTGRQIAALIASVELVAPTDFTVLITGETGTGKELIVEGLHRLSNRAKGPFVPVDCGSITPTLIESELFGHEKGSYTGAHQSQPGKMEMASGGTLFLDEISNLTLALQAKLLRALEERKIWRVGGIRPIDVDIRVVGAANEDLGAMVQKNLFRKDLYYRLSEFSISIPPLRDRPEDIIFLATRFLMSAKAELTKDILGFSQEAVELLLAFEWPGNVRELRNVIRQAALRCDKYILPENMTISPKKEKAASNTVQQITEIDCIAGNVSLKEVVRKTVADIEKQVITEVLIHARWNKAEAARILSVDYKTIHVKVKEYKISQP